jgi:hypothetical protein
MRPLFQGLEGSRSSPLMDLADSIQLVKAKASVAIALQKDVRASA